MAKRKQKKVKPVKKAKKQTKAVAVLNEKPLTITESKIIEGLDLLGITSKLDERAKRLFIEVAKINNLNPVKKEIYAVEMWDGETGKMILTPVTAYTVYIDRAEATGRLQYWHPVEEGTIKDGDYRAGVVIKRRDWPKEFTWWVRYKEVCRKKKDGTPVKVWGERPTFMTQKCAIGQGFRMCFRETLGAMPEILEEMEGGERFVNEVVEQTAVSQEQMEKIAERNDLKINQLAANKLLKDMNASEKFSVDEMEGFKDAALAMESEAIGLGNLVKEYQKKLDERSAKK
jgi:hypothetical protein